MKSNLATENADKRESFGLSFTVNAEHYFGLPERPNDMLLKDTLGKDPYKLLNIDHYRPKHELFTP